MWPASKNLKIQRVIVNAAVCAMLDADIVCIVLSCFTGSKSLG